MFWSICTRRTRLAMYGEWHNERDKKIPAAAGTGLIFGRFRQISTNFDDISRHIFVYAVQEKAIRRLGKINHFVSYMPTANQKQARSNSVITPWLTFPTMI
ncbi:Uncharacterised protein [Enterobacter cloacae]|nr:Uncharacterised protein [Enterobacter cloacae]